MSFYDFFIDNKHSSFFQKLLLRFNGNIVSYILDLNKNKKSISVLEVGPGKGYFFAACKKYKNKIEYTAIDRNEKILNILGIKNKYLAEMPNFPKINKKYDVIYISYVAEHLKNGREVYEMVENCKNNLKNDGRLILFTPDVMKQKMEFWNIDYTHIYPTTKRNLTMILNEAGLKKVDIYDVNGLLTYKWFTNKFLYLVLRATLFFYDYRFFSFFYSIFFENTINDPFYRVYCLLKEENIMTVARNN